MTLTRTKLTFSRSCARQKETATRLSGQPACRRAKTFVTSLGGTGIAQAMEAQATGSSSNVRMALLNREKSGLNKPGMD